MFRPSWRLIDSCESLEQRPSIMAENQPSGLVEADSDPALHPSIYRVPSVFENIFHGKQSDPRLNPKKTNGCQMSRFTTLASKSPEGSWYRLSSTNCHV
ncbi:hypothetical protein JTE90_014652 [Oedothorax gibbosus]|uniref:Uncharacterized protein n=1 Tax=Oedothorax gibbosus TaxID=931172 RepID=A0AAV6V9C1_9ARAC|nr:hypothetical protein JTE90_014652 [Oedothorax gibbosus]